MDRRSIQWDWNAHRDGWHVYPAKNGVLNSLRWEQMRNGIQDYEYLWIIENMVIELRVSLGSRFNWVNPKQRGKEISTRIIKNFSEYSSEPDVLYSAKMEIINEMLDFNQSPKVYIQTNPMEGPGLRISSKIELCGWAEPGTNITINNTKVNVGNDVLFVTMVNKSSENFIRVEVSNSKGTKEIIRVLAE